MTNLQLAYLKLRSKLAGVFLFCVPRTMVFTLNRPKLSLLSTYVHPLGNWASPAWFLVVGVDADNLYLHAMPSNFTPPQSKVTSTFFDYTYLVEVGA